VAGIGVGASNGNKKAKIQPMTTTPAKKPEGNKDDPRAIQMSY